MSFDENEELIKEGKEERKERKQPLKWYIVIAAAALLVGFAIGSSFGGTPELAGWIGNDEPTEIEPGAEDGFEEQRPQLEQQLRQEKENEILMQHLEDLREASDVETDLEGIEEGDPDAVVAVVNGEEVKMERLLAMEEQQKQQLMMMGMDPDSEEGAQMIQEMRPQLMDNLIMTALLQQEAREGISISEEEVLGEYENLAAQFGGEEALEEQIEKAGMTSDDLKEEIAEQLSIQAYIEQYVEENLEKKDLDFSEEELRELYEAQQPGEMEQPMEIEIEGE